MTYGEEHGTTQYLTADGAQQSCAPGSPEFFQQIDRMLDSWNLPLHDQTGPFGRIFDYAGYKDKSVLEVGCGMGSLAMYWAQRGARMTAVDLTRTAVERTTQRFALLGLKGTIRQEDGRHLSFSDQSFDYAYSWGVLHHSPDLASSLRELLRVVKPGGGYGLMLYHRRSLYQWYRIQYVEGFLHGESQFLKPLELTSRYTDGWENDGNPHTWPVTKEEIRGILGPGSDELNFRVLGTELNNLFPRALVLPRVLRWMPRGALKVWGRRWGWSLWIEGRKKILP